MLAELFTHFPCLSSWRGQKVMRHYCGITGEKYEDLRALPAVALLLHSMINSHGTVNRLTVLSKRSTCAHSESRIVFILPDIYGRSVLCQDS